MLGWTHKVSWVYIETTLLRPTLPASRKLPILDLFLHHVISGTVCVYWRCLSSDISSTGHRPHLVTIRPNSCIPNQFNFYLLLAQGEVVTEDWTIGNIKIKIYVNQPNRSKPTSRFRWSCLASTRRCVVCCCGCCWGFGGLKSGWNHQSQGTM